MTFSKKLFICFLFSFMILYFGNFSEVSAKTYSGKCGANATWTYNSKDKILHISGQGAITQQILPQKKRTNRYQSISPQKIYIHEGITSIENCSLFKLIKTSTQLFLPDSLQKLATTAIAPLAFASNGYISKIILPDTLTQLGSGAFYGCSNLSYINLSNKMKITSISDYHVKIKSIDSGGVPHNGSFSAGTFSNNFLNTLTIPNSVKSIEPNTFQYRSPATLILGKDFDCAINTGENSLKLYLAEFLPLKIVIPKTVTRIADGAFCRSGYIQKIIARHHISSIGKYAFADTNLEEIYCSQLDKIGKAAFYCCPLYTVELGNVHYIDKWAFYDCGFIYDISLGNEVTYIGKDAFSMCSSTPRPSVNYHYLTRGVRNPMRELKNTVQTILSDGAYPFSHLKSILSIESSRREI